MYQNSNPIFYRLKIIDQSKTTILSEFIVDPASIVGPLNYIISFDRSKFSIETNLFT